MNLQAWLMLFSLLYMGFISVAMVMTFAAMLGSLVDYHKNNSKSAADAVKFFAFLCGLCLFFFTLSFLGFIADVIKLHAN